MAGTRDRAHAYTFQTKEEDARWRGSGERRERRTVGPGETACPGGCNSAWRRQQKLLDAYEQTLKAWEASPSGEPPKEPETRPLSPLPGNPFCPADQAVHRRLLGEIDDLAAIIARDNDGHRRGPDAERVSGSKYAASPSPVTDDLDELAHMLRGWEAVARGDDDTPPRRGYLATEITTTTAWLIAHFDRLIEDTDVAEDFAREIREWHERLKKAAKAGTGRRHMKRPCPRCDRFSLYQVDDADYVACSRTECNRMLSWGEWLAYDENFGKADAVVPGAA